MLTLWIVWLNPPDSGLPPVLPQPLRTISFIDPDSGEIFSSQGLGAGMVTVDQGVIPLLIDP